MWTSPIELYSCKESLHLSTVEKKQFTKSLQSLLIHQICTIMLTSTHFSSILHRSVCTIMLTPAHFSTEVYPLCSHLLISTQECVHYSRICSFWSFDHFPVFCLWNLKLIPIMSAHVCTCLPSNLSQTRNP